MQNWSRTMLRPPLPREGASGGEEAQAALDQRRDHNPAPAAHTRENILVIKHGALGDFVQAMGAAAAIRAHHQGAEITLLTTAPFADLARSSPYFDQVWIDERPGRFDFG